MSGRPVLRPDVLFSVKFCLTNNCFQLPLTDTRRPLHLGSERLELAAAVHAEDSRLRRKRARDAAFAADPTPLKKVSRDNPTYTAMVEFMEADALRNGGRQERRNHWNCNRKFMVHHMSWEFLGIYVTDGSAMFDKGHIKLGMYFPAIRVVREFALQLVRWDKLARNPSALDSYKLSPSIVFKTTSVSRGLVWNLRKKSWRMSGDVSYGGEEGGSFSFSLARADIDEHLREWESIGMRILAFAAESRTVLDRLLAGVQNRRNSAKVYLMDVETTKGLVESNFRDFKWLRDILLGFLAVDHESETASSEKRIASIAMRSGGVVSDVRTCRSTPWLGCLSDLGFGSSHRPSLMRLEEFTEFFETLKEGVSVFGSQWAALAARRYLFGAISGDGCVSREEARRMEICLLINNNIFLKELHVILYHLAFGVEVKVHLTKRPDGIPESVGDNVCRKFALYVVRRNDVITVARHCRRPGIEHNFMSPLKLGKMLFIADKLKHGERSRPAASDAIEEEAVESDKARWISTLARVAAVRRRYLPKDKSETDPSGASYVDDVQSDTGAVDDTDHDFLHNIDSDIGSVADAGYDSYAGSDSESEPESETWMVDAMPHDSDTGSDSEAWMADAMPPASEGSGGS